MKKKVAIVQGGWDGHEPKKVSTIFKAYLEEIGFQPEIYSSMDIYDDLKELKEQALIISCWTMGEIKEEACKNILTVVEEGCGIAGVHGGICDSYRQSVEWQFLTGGQWVAHPGNEHVKYQVNMKKSSSDPIIEGIDDFTVESEQYYMHVDPVVNVLATTRFPTVSGPHSANGQVDMPVAWTKRWGKGRVFYCSVGHIAVDVEIPQVKTLLQRGCAWAGGLN